MTFPPTPEQEAIIAAARDRRESLLVDAKAGTGKTTTLELLANALDVPSALAVAFNKRIVNELEGRFPPTFTIKTLNGLGHQAWSRAINRRLTLDDRKLGKIVSDLFRKTGFSGSTDDWDIVRSTAAAAMQAGLVPTEFTHYHSKSMIPDDHDTWESLLLEQSLSAEPHLARLAREVLIESIKQSFAGRISFDDQIYMSALFGGRFPQFPLVLVDEAQDLSPLNREQIRHCATDRLVIVGDQRQSIYAFRGADHESIAKLRALRPDWIELPLNVTFRCPKAIVRICQDHAPGFTAAEANPEGKILSFDKEWTWSQVEKEANGSAICVICRNNAPLLSLAFKLLKQGTAVSMLGRDIGKNLTTLSKKIMKDDETPKAECFALIDAWQNNEESLARANKKEHLIAGIDDRAECLRAVLQAEGLTNAGDLRTRLADLFSRDKTRVTLSSGHRAKGLEWPVVLHLDPWRIPSKYAQRDPSQLEQEKNLLYVINTRTKLVQIRANGEDFSEGETLDGCAVSTQE